MPSYSSLSPVAVAVYGALNVAALLTLAPGGVFDDLPEGATYPCVLFSVQEQQQHGGFGTKPGVGALPEISLRVHVFTQADGFKTAQAVMAKALQLLADPPAVSGYGSWAIFHDDTIPLRDQLIAGVKVQELVASFRLFVEEQ